MIKRNWDQRPLTERIALAIGELEGFDSIPVTRKLFSKHRNAVLIEIFRPWTDDRLVSAYQDTDGEPGNPIADLLAAELERREVDF